MGRIFIDTLYFYIKFTKTACQTKENIKSPSELRVSLCAHLKREKNAKYEVMIGSGAAPDWLTMWCEFLDQSWC